MVTPISPEDEALRSRLGYRGPQNFDFPSVRRRLEERLRRAAGRPAAKPWFYNHIEARRARNRLGSETWDRYIKFSIVRSPFDYAVSRYFWNRKRGYAGEDFRQFLLSRPEVLLVNRRITHVEGVSSVDFMIRYERMQEDLEKLTRLLGLEGDLGRDTAALSAKSSSRPAGATAQSMFRDFDEGVRLVEILCQEEIEAYGYAAPGNVPAA